MYPGGTQMGETEQGESGRMQAWEAKESLGSKVTPMYLQQANFSCLDDIKHSDGREGGGENFRQG